MARQSVSDHLAVLEAAHLVTTARRGREKLRFLDAAPVNAAAERWIDQYARESARTLAHLHRALELPAMSESAFVRTTYIRTTPERRWQALTDPAFTRRYWGVAFGTAWRPGSPMVWEEKGARTADPEQVVLESEPYRRLSYTWRTFTPRWAGNAGGDADVPARLVRERRSQVTFEIEPLGDTVTLTVVHEATTPAAPCSTWSGTAGPPSSRASRPCWRRARRWRSRARRGHTVGRVVRG